MNPLFRILPIWLLAACTMLAAPSAKLTVNIETGALTGNDFSAAEFCAANDIQRVLVAGADYLAPTGNGSSLTGLTKSQVSLSNVDNTSDASKPISTATQTALDAKASASALTTHTSDTANPHSVTKTQVGLSNVDNTSDAAKPISTATQTALDAKQPLDSDLTAVAALTTTSFGRSLLGLADEADARTLFGLGTLATQSGTFSGTHSGTTSGTNSGDQTITLTGDITGTGTGSFATTLPTVNSNVGSFGSASLIPIITVNAKGQITAASTASVSAGIGGSTGTTDNAVLAADGTGGATLQKRAIIIDDFTASTQANVALKIDDGSTANISAVITPKGTGAFILFSKPDGTTTGGDPRGSKAVDLSSSHSLGAGYVPTGANSFAAGQNIRAFGSGAIGLGSNNYITGTNAVCLGQNSQATGSPSFAMGNAAVASGADSIALGSSASATGASAFATGTTSTASGAYSFTHGMWVVANARGMRGFTGDGYFGGQIGEGVEYCQTIRTTNATPTEMFLDGASQGADERIPIDSGYGIFCIVQVSGFKSDGSAAAHFIRQCAWKNVAGTTSEIYAPVTIGTDNSSGTSIAITANDTNDSPKILVTGITSETWRWVATIYGQRVPYGN